MCLALGMSLGAELGVVFVEGLSNGLESVAIGPSEVSNDRSIGESLAARPYKGDLSISESREVSFSTVTIEAAGV